MNQTGYEGLAISIIRQAVIDIKDYKNKLPSLKKQMIELGLARPPRELKDLEENYNSAINFIESQWFEVLAGTCAEKIREEVRQIENDSKMRVICLDKG